MARIGGLVRPIVLVGFLFLWVLNVTVYAQEASSEPGIRLSDLIREALEKNPEIMAAKERWQSKREIIEARRSFPDPQFSYTYFIESLETRVGPQRNIFGAKQKFPFYGKRDLRAEVAAKEADALEASYEAVKQEVVRQVKDTFYALFYLNAIIGVTHKEKEVLKRFERIATTKYETGKGSQQDILKVQVEISKLDDRLLALERRKKTVTTMLNKLLDRPVDRPLGRAEQPKFRDFFYEKQDLFLIAKEKRPELKGGLALIERSEKTLSLAKKDYYPDITIGVNYFDITEGPLDFSDNGQDAFNVMFTVNVPIWRKKLSSQVHSATRMIKSEKDHYQETLNRVLFEVEDVFFKIGTARDTFSLYKNVLIPQADQAMKSNEIGYITGIASFLDLLDAERVLLQVQFGYWKAYADYLTYIADMERAVGMELAEEVPEEILPGAEEE